MDSSSLPAGFNQENQRCLVYDPTLHTFFCRDDNCKVAVLPFKAAFIAHLKTAAHCLPPATASLVWDTYGCLQVPAESATILRQKYVKAGFSVGFLPPVEFLDTVTCKKCPIKDCDILVPATGSSPKHHIANYHHGCSYSSYQWDRAISYSCQRFFKGLNKGYFRIPATSAALQCFDFGASFGSPSIPTDQRSFGGFAAAAKIHRRLQQSGLSLDEAASYIVTPTETEAQLFGLLKDVHPALISIFGSAEQVMTSSEVLHSAHIDFAASGIVAKDRPVSFLFDEVDGSASASRYATFARTLIVIALRLYFHNDPSLRSKLPHPLKESLSAFIEFANRQSYDLDPSEYIFHLLLVYKHIFFQEALLPETCTSMFAYFCSACLCVTSTSTRDTTTAVLAGLSCVSSRLTGIMYLVPCIPALIVYQYSAPDLMQTEYDWFASRLKTNSRVGVAVFTELRATCARLRGVDVRIPSTIICSRHPLCLIHEAIELSAADIGVAVQSLLGKIWADFSLLFPDHPLPDSFRSELDGLLDDHSNKQPSYWSLSDHRNQQLLAHYSTWKYTANASVGPMCIGSKNWIDTANSMLIRLMTLVHLTSGAPGRMTELGSMLLRNTPVCFRSVFFQPGLVMFVPSFTKQRVVCKGTTKKFARYIFGDVAILFKLFYILVYPSIVHHHDTNGDDQPSDSRRNFVRDNILVGLHPCTSLASLVTPCFLEIGITFTVSQYRQYQTALVKLKHNYSAQHILHTHIHGSITFPDTGQYSPLTAAQFLQAGHKVATANNYYAGLGGSFVEQQTIERDPFSFAMYHLASVEWNALIGLITPNTPGVPSYIRKFFMSPSKTSEGLLPLSNSDLYPLPPPPPVPPLLRSSPSLRHTPPNSSPLTPPLPSLSINTEAALRLSPHPPNHLPSPLIDFPSPSYRRYSNSALQNGFDSLQALRFVTKKANATFRSSAQEAAIHSVAACESHIAVTLPTGGGKTAVALAPIRYERGYSIWICPLLALLQETRSRIKAAQINCIEISSFAMDQEAHASILLVCVEQCKGVRFDSILQLLRRHQLLNRLVVDEAHSILLSYNFRPAMEYVRAASDSGNACQVLLLSATIPESLESHITSFCISSTAVVRFIRPEAYRENLCYEIVPLPENSLATLQTQVFNRISSINSSYREPCRIIVFCFTISVAVSLHKFLSAPASQFSPHLPRVQPLLYHSKVHPSDKAKVMHSWHTTKISVLQVVVATDAFLCGVDMPDVRAVIFAGGARSLIDFYQGAGRAGRDGHISKVISFYHPLYLSRQTDSSTWGPYFMRHCGDFAHWAEGLTCRRLYLEKTMGSASPISCATRYIDDPSKAIGVCDNCEPILSSQSPSFPSSSSVAAIPPPTPTSTSSPHLRRMLSFSSPTLSQDVLPSLSYPISKKRTAPRVVRPHPPPPHRDDSFRAYKTCPSFPRAVPRASRLSSYPSASAPSQFSPSATSIAIQYSRHFAVPAPTAAERKWFIDFTTILSRYCIPCLALSAQRPRSAPPNSMLLISCPGFPCNRKKRCLRCTQSGHSARDCPVFPSRKLDGICRVCYCGNVANKLIHGHREFGVHACKVKHCMDLCLLVWFSTDLRRILAAHDSPVPFQLTTSDADIAAYINYLTDDKRGKVAAVVSVTSYLFRTLGLSSLK